jgi:hypothetical protein
MSMNWYEIWADEGHAVPYVLLLRPVHEGFEVLDPTNGNKSVLVSSSYEDAKMWLLEDEYVLVGRKELDE